MSLYWQITENVEFRLWDMGSTAAAATTGGEQEEEDEDEVWEDVVTSCLNM